MILYIDKGLPVVHMKFVSLDMNEVIFFTHVDSCAVMNVGNLQLHQWIINTNPDIAGSYIQFDY